jgi:hypothetical protein
MLLEVRFSPASIKSHPIPSFKRFAAQAINEVWAMIAELTAAALLFGPLAKRSPAPRIVAARRQNVAPSHRPTATLLHPGSRSAAKLNPMPDAVSQRTKGVATRALRMFVDKAG